MNIECAEISPYPNIILIGMMGSGKSTVGKELSKNKDLTFVDTDSSIEDHENCTINDIFRINGEDYFRTKETQMLARFLESGMQGRIISPGGVIILRSQNRELIKKLGFVVWLNATVDTLFDRISYCTTRPLLHTANPKETLRNIVHQREHMYRKTAHLTIDTDNLHVEEIAYGIIESAKLFRAQSY